MHPLNPGNVAPQPTQFFNSDGVENLIADYRRTGSTETLGEIITRCQPISLSLIRSRHTFQYQDEDELLSVVNRKLLTSLPQYEPGRGSAFSFVSRVAVNMLCTQVTLTRKLAGRYQALEKVLVDTRADEKANLNSAIALDDLAQQIRSIKSACTLDSERQAQKWYVESFIDSDFSLHRHSCANASMKVYGLSHKRSRQLYDLTLLEIRRVLWDECRHQPISPGRLRGTKGRLLLRYTNFLTPAEFSKFTTLMKDLAPGVVLSVKPGNAARIRAGQWDAVRENVTIILQGDPEATPLFKNT